MGFKKLELSGRVAVVIGGTSGIGRAIAHGLAEAGADVVCTSRRIEQVEVVASEIESLGRRTIRCVSDVSDRASLENLLSTTTRSLGNVDILVNSAGITKRTPTLELADEDW
ncbi:MAG: SDR family NAD(P)-dependent oxidoreductase, partial [Pyrinomonadaceae bacterium]